jgi:glycosyltransferase involved in cell wall biosynthesis
MAASISISILILTRNEERDLPECLKSVTWSDDIHVFDSFSEDATIDIARAAGATITQRRFDNWSAHQNWGLENLPFKHPWVLYIDADERISPSLLQGIARAPLQDCKEVAFEIQRRDFAWNGRWLKHAQISPFYLRLFRPQKMRYERLVNPVSIPDGPTGRVEGFLDHYPFSKGFRNWWLRHLNYADMEAAMRMSDMEQGMEFRWSKALLSPDFTERRYHQKGLFYRLPFRPVIKYFYMVFWRGAFLDGRAGVTYALLQSIYEYFIVLKTSELIDSKARAAREK